MSHDRLAEAAAKLTANAAITLAHRNRPAGDMQLGHICTGLGKRTHLAWLGVFNTLRAAACAVEVQPPGRGSHYEITPLGLEVAAYLKAHWDEAAPRFRRPTERRQEQIAKAAERIFAALPSIKPGEPT